MAYADAVDVVAFPGRKEVGSYYPFTDSSRDLRKWVVDKTSSELPVTPQLVAMPIRTLCRLLCP